MLIKYLAFTTCLLTALTINTAHAGATDKLHAFISGTQSGQANFTQTVTDKKGKKVQAASGIMHFLRPGKFRWEYRKPYEQLIVGDGAKFWLYDMDLNQVTVKKLNAALGSSPAALLSGNNEIDNAFTLQDSSSHDGLEWLDATAKTKDSGFDRIAMGFNDKGDLAIMELRDAFGMKTEIRFTDMKRNPQLPSHLFRFVPPKGADVLSE